MWNIGPVHAGSVSQQDFSQPLHHRYGKDTQATGGGLGGVLSQVLTPVVVFSGSLPRIQRFNRQRHV